MSNANCRSGDLALPANNCNLCLGRNSFTLLALLWLSSADSSRVWMSQWWSQLLKVSCASSLAPGCFPHRWAAGVNAEFVLMFALDLFRVHFLVSATVDKWSAWSLFEARVVQKILTLCFLRKLCFCANFWRATGDKEELVLKTKSFDNSPSNHWFRFADKNSMS